MRTNEFLMRTDEFRMKADVFTIKTNTRGPEIRVLSEAISSPDVHDQGSSGIRMARNSYNFLIKTTITAASRSGEVYTSWKLKSANPLGFHCYHGHV